MYNIILINYQFPPLNDIAARRYGQMVEYFNDFGINPIIVTSRSSGDLPVTISEKNIIRIGEQKQKSTKIDHSEDKFSVPKSVEFLKKMISKDRFYFRSYDRSMFSWYHELVDEADSIKKQIVNPKLIVASYGPSAALWFGRYLHQKMKIPWIADMRDLAAMRSDNRNFIAQIIDDRIERILFSSVHSFVSVSETLSGLLKTKYDKPGITVYNGWYKNIKTKSPLTQIKKEKKDPYLYYSGRFYSHRMNAVNILLESLTFEPGINLRIRSLGPPDLDLKIKTRISELNLNNRIEFLEPCSPDAVMHEAENALANVVFEEIETKDIWSRGTLTGKFLPLLPLKNPILSIARSDNEMGYILKKTQKGILTNNIKGVIEFLQNLKHSDNNFAGNQQAVNFYSKQNQASILCKYLTEIINQSSHKSI